MQNKGRTTDPVELVLTALCGPFQALAGGSKYLLTFISDFSSHFVAYPLKEKCHTMSMLERYIVMVTNTFNRRPQTLRSNNGDEYITTHSITPKKAGDKA